MENFNSFVIISPYYDVYKNLAIENLLLSHCDKNKGFLFLWQNDDCVVIGANQNAYAECNTSLIKSDNVKIARRRTGGGAVWHDRGNINFSFIMPRGVYDERAQSEIVVSALYDMGLECSLSGRNDIELNGFKISGNAYFRGKNASLHHGTLLVCVNLEKLAKYLVPCKEKLAKKGVASVRSRVANLKDIRADVDIKSIKASLIKKFSEHYKNGKSAKISQFLTDSEIEDKMAEFSDEEYIFGKFNSFNSSFSKRFSWGVTQVDLKIDYNKKITHFKISSDAMENCVCEFAESYFSGKSMDDVNNFDKINSEVKNFALKKGILEDSQKKLAEVIRDISVMLIEKKGDK